MAKQKNKKEESYGLDSVTRSSTPIYIGVGVVIVAAIIGALIWAMNQESDDSSNTAIAEFQTVKVEGAALPQYQNQGGDPSVGQPAPTVEGSTFDGTDVTIGNDGRAKVIGFMAHWCQHCRNELPVYTSFIKGEGANHDIDFYAVATNSSPQRANYPPSEWFEKEGFTGKVLTDDRNFSAGTAFGIGSFPYFVILDKDHKVVARTSGELTTGQLTEYVKAATGSGPAPSAPAATDQTSPAQAPAPEGAPAPGPVPAPAPAP